MKKLRRLIIWLLILTIVVLAVRYTWPPSIITAFAARGMCTGVFVMEREPERITEEDLSFFPISLAKTKIDYEEKSVSARLFGMAKREAIYRKGLGAVLVLDIPEEKLRATTFDIPDPGYDPDTIPWPKGDLFIDSMPAGVDYNRLDNILDNAFDQADAEPFKNPWVWQWFMTMYLLERNTLNLTVPTQYYTGGHKRKALPMPW